MAPVGEAYFPPLDRCFSGEYQLLSWEVAYIALSSHDRYADDETLKRYFADPQTTDLLVNILSPYSTPTAQTKSTFDTKTSAINVTPSVHARYNIAQIKADTLWLSKTTVINEVAALRLAILEWQTGPVTQLLQGNSLEQPTHPLHFSVQRDPPFTLGESVSQDNALLETQDVATARHARLLRIYLSERLFLLKTAEYILSHLVCHLNLRAGHDSTRQRAPGENWLIEVGEAILSLWKIESAPDGKGKKVDFITTAVGALRSRLQGIEKGCPWIESEEIFEEIQVAWAQNQSLEMIHIMQIAMDLLEVPKDVLPSGPILTWFRLMSDICFFDGLRQPIESLQGLYDLPLQSLAVLVSLALIDISATIELLAQTSTSLVPSVDPTDGSPYAHSPPTVNELNDIFISLAPLKVVSPVTLAWSIITQSIREMALTTRESKETRQSLRAADRYGAADSSDTDGAERYSLRSVSALRRRSSTGSDTSLQSLLVEDVYDAITITAVHGDPISYLAMNAVQQDNVFDVVSTIASDYCTVYGFEHNGRPGQKMRNVLLDLIRSSVDFVRYQPALISTVVAVLTGTERFWDLLDKPIATHDDQPSNLFILDQTLRQKILLVAASRFPYESVPFLEFCRALAFQYTSSDGSEAAPWANLEELDFFTCRLPVGFEATSPIREEEEGDFIKLTDTLNVLIGSEETDLLAHSNPSHRQSQAFLPMKSPTAQIVIPAGTTGVVHSETKPFVVGWNYQYHGLAYMGRILQCASATSSSVGSSNAIISPVLVAEVIQLISVLLVSAMKNPATIRESSLPLQSAQSILGQASDGLDRNQDIISVILEIFENELHDPQPSTQEDTSLDLLAQCVNFTNALVLLMPDRVWPFLGRSGLLGIGQEENQLGWVISQEMAVGRYNFLLGCVRLYEALIEDTLYLGGSRKIPMKALARFGSTDSLGSGVSQIAMQNILLSFSRSMVDALESTMSWRFIVPTDRMEINQRLCSAFEKILNYCYGVNDNPDIFQKVTSPLAKAAAYINEAFLSPTNDDFVVKPLLTIFASAIGTQTTTLPTVKDQYQIEETTAALGLAARLLSITTALHQSPSHLEKELFKATPVMVQVCTVHESYRLPVVNLFDVLLSSSAISNRQPPSLLGYLDHDGANCFLKVLSQLDRPLSDDALSVAIWSLLTTIVSKRQQWFAMYVLTGSTPRESLIHKKDQTGPALGNEEPILSIALNSLCSPDKLNPPRAVAMLEFVATSADYWPQTFTKLAQHPLFLKTISEYAARIGSMPIGNGIKSTKSSEDYSSLQMASYMAKILAMYTHYTQQVDNQKFARGLVPHLNYLIKNAISAPGYNNSLHRNLRTNFEAKFPGCTLADFKRTGLSKAALGESFFYDTDFAGKVLSHDPAWRGRKGLGFAEEFRRANINLSVVEAHVNLFHGWKFLLVELSGPLATDPKFQKIMAAAVTDCLQANADNNLPQAIFDTLSSSRADLAFTLLQRLVEVDATEQEFGGILPTAWATLRTYSTDLEAALNDRNADYYRMLLRILYLALQAHTSASSPAARNSSKSLLSDSSMDSRSPPSKMILQIVSEVLSVLVARGFRSLTILLHSSPNNVYPTDFSILTAILRCCLRLPNLDQYSTQLLASFCDSQTAQCAATLLSWSDQLASSTSGDPVFGELSIAFLLELSSDIALAESLAVDGVLGQVLSTNIIRVLQSRAFSPFDTPNRMYTIWARGLLPLLLNLLNAIGAPMAAEVAAALNRFPQQLSQSSSAFASHARGSNASDGYITLSMATEAHDLALIVSMLKIFREAGASAAVLAGDIEEIKWDNSQVKEDVEGWLQERVRLRERIVATSKREEAWSRTKPWAAGGENQNMLEEKIVDELRHLVGILSSDSEAWT